ncbi:unnamed protein product [Effrenium voratum]|nr:unnamed protein product [Effrenium voratum]
MALNSIIATMEGPDHELWAVVIRNGSVEVEPWASLATLAADSPAAGALGRSASSPVLTTWEKPWEEPLGLALHRNGRKRFSASSLSRLTLSTRACHASSSGARVTGVARATSATGATFAPCRR